MNITLRALTVVGVLALTTPAQAESISIQRLKEALASTGTTVVYRKCGPEHARMQGFYEFDKQQKLDQITVCTNNVDVSADRFHWEVLAHEATHAVQICKKGETLFVPEEHPSILREIREYAPHYDEILRTRYTGTQRVKELEAFWMELQPQDDVIDYIAKACKSDNQ